MEVAADNVMSGMKMSSLPFKEDGTENLAGRDLHHTLPQLGSDGHTPPQSCAH